jgi:DNA-binding response OmpR family regulator
MLPGVDGLDVCRRLRQESGVPIIMLTARVEEADRIVGLELGADDYVTKPFSPRELVARVRATLRRVHGQLGPSAVIRAGDVELDTSALTATVGGQPVDLTPTEFRLLATLARQPGRIFDREQLLEAIHGVAFDGYDRSVDSHIKNLRRKIEPDPRLPRYIQTVYGVGYRFVDR